MMWVKTWLACYLIPWACQHETEARRPAFSQPYYSFVQKVFDEL